MKVSHIFIRNSCYHPLFIWYSWNIAESGVKHQTSIKSIDPLFIVIWIREMIRLLKQKQWVNKTRDKSASVSIILIPIWISIISIWFKSHLSLAAIPDMWRCVRPEDKHVTVCMRVALCCHPMKMTIRRLRKS